MLNKLILIFAILFVNLFGQGISHNNDFTFGNDGIVVKKSSVSYHQDSDSLFLRFTTQPTTARKLIIDQFIRMLNDTIGSVGLRDSIDVLVILAGHDSTSSKLNWCQNKWNATTVNKVNFAIDTGWTRSATGSYINSNFNISLGTNYTQNSGSIYFYSRTDVNETSIDIGIYKAVTFETRLSLRLGGALYYVINAASSLNGTNANSLGGYLTYRYASDSMFVDKNGIAILKGAKTSVAPISANIFVLGGNDGTGALAYGCTRQCSGYMITKGFVSATKRRGIHNCFEWYFDQLGIGVVP